MLFNPVKVVFGLIVFLGCFQAITNPLRLLSVFNTAYFNLSIIYFIGVLSFFVFFLRKGRLYCLEIILLLLVLINLVYATLLDNNNFHMLTGFIRPVFFLAVVKLFSSVSRDKYENMSITRSVYFLSLSYTFGVLFTAYIYLFVGGVRASASAIVLAIPLFYFYLNRKYFKAIFILALFFLGGKFGPLLGVVVSVAVALGFKLKKFLISMFVVVIVVGIVLLLIEFGNVNFLKIPVLAKVNFHQIIEKGWDIHLFDYNIMGGRLSEASSALSGLPDNVRIGVFMFGGGLGYNFSWESFNDIVINSSNRGVHFTPIAVFVEYGFPFLVALLMYLYTYVKKSVRIIVDYKKKSHFITLWAFFIVVSVVNMITAYSLFTNLFLAVSIGIMQSYSRNKPIR